MIMPNSSDKGFAQKLVKTNIGKHPKFAQPRLATETTFNIEHYAGTVTYDATEWCEKK